MVQDTAARIAEAVAERDRCAQAFREAPKATEHLAFRALRDAQKALESAWQAHSSAMASA